MEAISPLDGRYREVVASLREFFSEHALMRERCRVEIAYLRMLAGTGLLGRLEPGELERMADLEKGFGEADFLRIKEIEKVHRHDVKACELFLRERLGLARPGMIHFGLTSEDVNNLAWSLLLSRFRDREQAPLAASLCKALCDLAERYEASPFPAHTHGQIASPTTAGKELCVFGVRLVRQLATLKRMRFLGKLNGATGTYAAMYAAFPDFDWVAFSHDFVRQLGLVPNIVTTQIEDHDTWAEYFACVSRVNNIIMDLDQDMWSYISRGYFVQEAVRGETGSSTMPHKVNPIHFENSEGNLAISNALLAMLQDKLCRSRMQRDLSDSTVERNIGVALAHSMLAMAETLKGLARVSLDEAACRAEVEAHPEVLAEAYQTILRAAGVADAYERMKDVTRGKAAGLEELHELARGLPVDIAVRESLLALTPARYIGASVRVCGRARAEIAEELRA
ncbi:MAG: adenylosuccinate lyase [Deltaproteobacteria bacterium]|nr:adenylosuccinate lyase [Deltaproteobacteria bacterium]